eukprot:2750700-Lingulodinium_polyedra.AAC.1
MCVRLQVPQGHSHSDHRSVDARSQEALPGRGAPLARGAGWEDPRLQRRPPGGSVANLPRSGVPGGP